MKINLVSVSRTLWLKLFSSIKRYPEAILMVFFTTVMLMVLNHFKGDLASPAGLLLQRFTMVVALGLPVSLCLRSFLDYHPVTGIFQKIFYYALATGFLLVYFFLILRIIQPVTVIRYTVISVAIYFLCPVIPSFYRKGSFERFVIYLLTRLAITIIYAMVLYLGLIAIIFAINTLFSAGISNKIYLDIFFIAGGIFGPLFFLADVPGSGEELTQTDFPKVLKILLLFILIPLILAYSLILYAYFAKILITQTWPNGMVANLVFWFACISLAVTFLISPLKKSDNPAKWFLLIFPKAILPLILMMFVSVGIRIRHFGVTEDRYYILACSLWIFACMVYLCIAKNPRTLLFPLSFSMVAVLTIIGPWSAFSVSVRSQNSRFEKLLVKNNLLNNGTIVISRKDVPEEDRKEISAVLFYFKEMHSFRDLRYLPGNFNEYRTEKVFGFALYEDHTRNFADYTYFNHVLQRQEIYSLNGFDFFSDITSEKPSDYTAKVGELSVDYSAGTRLIRVFKENKEIYKGSPDGFAVKIASLNRGNYEIDAAGMSIEDQNKNVKVLYLFKKIRGSVSKRTGKARFETEQFYFFIKLKSE